MPPLGHEPCRGRTKESIVLELHATFFQGCHSAGDREKLALATHVDRLAEIGILTVLHTAAKVDM